MNVKKTERFILVANGRSGSTLLVDLLNSHPAIQCEGELLNEQVCRGWRRPFGWLARVFPAWYLAWRTGQFATPIYGCKLKTGRQVYDLGGTLRSLHRHGWRLISLQRRDALQQTFSWAVAQVTGRWQNSVDGLTSPQHVTLNPSEFLRDFHTCVADRQSLTDLLRSLPHLALTYEDDLADAVRWANTSERLCAFLGAPPAPLTSRIVKTWERPYAELVSNYAEIMRLVERELPEVQL